MSSLIHSRKLTAPGRMDVVEKVLRDDPFFNARLGGHSKLRPRNRRGVRKNYSTLTVDLVKRLAELGLDAVTMRREEVIARAFAYCVFDKTQRAMAA